MENKPVPGKKKPNDSKEKAKKSKFEMAVLAHLSENSKQNRTAKDARFKTQQTSIKEAGIQNSSNKLFVKINEDLLKMSEEGNKMSIADRSDSLKQLKTMEQMLRNSKDVDSEEARKLTQLVSDSRDNLSAMKNLPDVMGKSVGNVMIASTAIMAGLFSESPILALGVGLAGKSLKDAWEARVERRRQMADQNDVLLETALEQISAEENLAAKEKSEEEARLKEAMKNEEANSAETEKLAEKQHENLIDAITNDDILTATIASQHHDELIKTNEENSLKSADKSSTHHKELMERLKPGTSSSEENRREQAVRDAENMSIMETISDTLIAIKDSLLDRGDDKKGGFKIGALALGGLALGKMLMDALKGAMLGFAPALKKFVMKTLPKFLLKMNPITMILGAMMTGIDDAFNEFLISGKISNALASLFGGIVDFFTFGLISKEDIEKILNPVFDSIKNAILNPLETLEGLWKSVTDIFDGLVKKIDDTFDIDIKGIFGETINNIIDTFTKAFQFLFNIPGKILDGITDVGGDILSGISDFFTGNDVPEMVQPNVNKHGGEIQTRLEPKPTNRTAENVKSSIEQKEEIDKKAASKQTKNEGNVVVSAPTTNNSSSSKTIYNNMTASPSRRVVTE